jgi:hypothetical protein
VHVPLLSESLVGLKFNAKKGKRTRKGKIHAFMKDKEPVSDKTGAVMDISSETTGAVIAISDFCLLLPVVKRKRRLNPPSP